MSRDTQLVASKKNLVAQVQSEQSIKQLAAALPAHIPPQRFARLVISAINRTPALANCRPESFFISMMRCAEFGLLPDGRQGVLLPFGGDVQFIPMYQGLIDCACRSGKVRAITPQSVYEKDEFIYSEGIDPRFIHIPYIKGHPGELIGVYAVAHMASGHNVARFMPLWRVDEHKKRSPSVKRGQKSPWDTDYESMAWKTVIKELCKFIPQSAELAEVLEADDRQFDDIPLGGKGAIIDNQPEAPRDPQPEPNMGSDEPPPPEPVEFEEATGEIVETPAASTLPKFVVCPEGGPKAGKNVPSEACLKYCKQNAGCPAIGG